MKSCKYILIGICMVLGTSSHATDFDRSMGSDDPVMKSFYTVCMQELKKQHSQWFRFIVPYSASDVWKLCEHGFSLFKKHSSDLLIGTRIPRKIHQIWVGPNPFPEKYKQWQKTWQSLPGWEYKLWTDEEVKNFPLINRALYEREKNYGAKADILRIEILYKEGGLYVDTDFECLDSTMFDRMHSLCDFYTAMSPLDGEAILINNAIIAGIPGHPIFKGYIDTLSNLDEGLKTSLEQPENLIQRGPAHFAKSVIAHANTGYRDVILPASYVYPLGMYQIEKQFAHLIDSPTVFTEIKKAVCKPESFAIHWWDGSWNMPEAFQD